MIQITQRFHIKVALPQLKTGYPKKLRIEISTGTKIKVVINKENSEKIINDLSKSFLSIIFSFIFLFLSKENFFLHRKFHININGDFCKMRL